MTNIFVTKEFSRLARRAGVTDDGLKEAVKRAEGGKVDAHLGGGLVKQRIPRPSAGRSSGFRTIIAYRRGERAIFMHMFAKSQRSNLSEVELETLIALAKEFGVLNDEQLDDLAKRRGWRKLS